MSKLMLTLGSNLESPTLADTGATGLPKQRPEDLYI